MIIFNLNPKILNNSIPLWLKLSYSLMVAIIVPVYWHYYGPVNFLWFCDIGLLLMLIALWKESALLTSMIALGVLPLELFWFVGFLSGGAIISTADYMFDDSLHLYLRALSLFHFPLPVITIYMLLKFKYDPRALKLQCILVAILLPFTRLVSAKEENINWVFPPEILSSLPPYLYIPLITCTLILVVYIPVHLLLKKLINSGELKA